MAYRKRDVLSAVLMASSLLLVAISVSTLFPWANFTRTKEIGPVEYTLEASCDPVGFEYSLETRPTEGGILGGAMAGNVSLDPGRKTYPEARGKFLENLGLIYNSYRDKVYAYEIRMQEPPADSGVPMDPFDPPSVFLNVSLHSDMVPFWTEAGKNGMSVSVSFASCDLSEYLDPSENPRFLITVETIEVIGMTELDDNGNYEGDEIVLFSSSKGWTLKELNQSVEIPFDAVYPKGHEVMGVRARITAHLTDFWGRSEKQTLTGSAGFMNIYPIDTPTLVKGAGIPLSLIVIILTIITCAMAILLISRQSASYRVLALISGLSGISAATWFYLGMDAVIDLLGRRLVGAEEGLTFGPGIYLCMAGSIIMVLTGAFGIVITRSDSRKQRAQAQKFRKVD